MNAKGDDGHSLVAYWMRYVGDHTEIPGEESEPDVPEQEPEKPESKEVILKVRQLRKGM